jgi:hypothetical protein
MPASDDRVEEDGSQRKPAGRAPLLDGQNDVLGGVRGSVYLRGSVVVTVSRYTFLDVGGDKQLCAVPVYFRLPFPNLIP